MRTILIDTGPIVAFLNSDDTYHQWAIDTMTAVKAPLLTCEAVLSEAVYLIRRSAGGGVAVMELLARGLIRSAFRIEDEVAPVKGLMARYGNIPMDFADACLVRMTEVYEDSVLVTVDTEFRDIYRRHGRKTIPTVLPDGARRPRPPVRRK